MVCRIRKQRQHIHPRFLLLEAQGLPEIRRGERKGGPPFVVAHEQDHFLRMVDPGFSEQGEVRAGGGAAVDIVAEEDEQVVARGESVQYSPRGVDVTVRVAHEYAGEVPTQAHEPWGTLENACHCSNTMSVLHGDIP